MGLRDGISFQKLITDENKYPDQNNVQYLVIHDTGNTNKGATAINHYYYFLNNVGRSAHYFVDDHEVIQIIEDKDGAWHCGDGKGQYGITNTNSLSIETCVNSDGNYEEAIQNTIDLAAYLMYVYDLPMDRLVRHYDASRKNCPAQMNKDGQWTDWYNFKAAVAAKLKTYGPSSS
ncbi:MAG: N-acetylmuramoyl-L-alanine amidase family protein, partial [Bianqueaceae bacterium]